MHILACIKKNTFAHSATFTHTVKSSLQAALLPHVSGLYALSDEKGNTTQS